jgi:transcriptional repressor NrdR
VSPTEIDRVVEDIERELDRRESGEVESQELGQMVMDRLKSRDHIAYVRFASVYRNFQDPEEFYHEFRDLADRQAQREMHRAHYELPLEPPPAPEAPGPAADADERP